MRSRAAKLRAGAVGGLLERPAREINDALHSLVSLLDADVRALETKILDPLDDQVGLRALGAFLLEHRRPLDEAGKLAVEVVASLDLGAHPTVQAWAKAHGMRVRSFQRLFRQHVGASPKFLLRRRRLQEAALGIVHGEAGRLAELAAEMGYSDQAHFTRDMKAAAGGSPRQLRERLSTD